MKHLCGRLQTQAAGYIVTTAMFAQGWIAKLSAHVHSVSVAIATASMPGMLSNLANFDAR